MKTNEAIALRTRELLKEKKMTQYRLEQKSGIPHNTMICLMSGKYNSVNFKTILNIIFGLDMTVLEFFDSPLFKIENLDID